MARQVLAAMGHPGRDGLLYKLFAMDLDLLWRIWLVARILDDVPFGLLSDLEEWAEVRESVTRLHAAAEADGLGDALSPAVGS